ncbi:integrase [Polaribacter reichenbachii]|uniref:Integrase n=1 Tax=Polaribacter reichenbachii TaxID=996801 RepID=A0A1B8TRK6_9FLAO|nr:site-specific integrase [Polaribacter reichenbachii]APZ47794.1 integrase [Polaribacter reichenbachii]AUC18429.1 integrase [Polaribacter reichenbachii]OBY62220.1 integrase [Polaribacter reichenbachii]
MPNIFLLLRRVHDTVHDLPMKLNYSEPKIFTGGVDINSWSKLSSKEKKEALSKSWYIYYSFRNPKTGKLKRQTNIKAGVNLYKDKKSRFHILKQLKKSLEYILAKGFNPYQDNTNLANFIEELLIDDIDNKKVKSKNIPTNCTSNKEVSENNIINYSIQDAFTFALSIKSKVLSETSYKNFNSRIHRFKTWLVKQNIELSIDISTVDKKLVIQYLNVVLQKSSARNRNNTRTDLSSLFQTLADNEIIQDNFIKKINVLKSKPERNKTYTSTEQKDIFKYLKENDPILHLFVQFVSYNYLRPVEVCRLKVGDIDLIDRKISVKAKNKAVKIKIIPNILIEQLPDLTEMNKNDYLFTPNKIGGVWDTKENNKRDYFTKQFKKVKDHFKLGKEYGLYSFRHTFITKLYKEMAKTGTPFEVKSKLKLITGHATMDALELYLRDIDAVLPEDYSKLLK